MRDNNIMSHKMYIIANFAGECQHTQQYFLSSGKGSS